MEMQQLKGFVAVARNGSFSRGALKTFRSQPAITLQVQSLEEELGVKLFERLGKRKIVLTEEGRIFFDLVAPLTNSFDDLKARFDELMGQEEKGTIRIATHTSVMVYLLPDVIKAFKKRHPDWDLSVVNRTREDVIKMVADSEVDLGITSLARIPEKLDYQVFARFRRLLIVPQGHPLSTKKRVSLNDIAQYPLILPPIGSKTREKVDDLFAKEGLNYKLAMEISGRLATKVYVEMGLGISIVNEFYVLPDDKAKMSHIDVSGLFGFAERGILMKKGRHLSKTLDEFVRAFFISNTSEMK